METPSCRHCSNTRNLVSCEQCPTRYCRTCDDKLDKLKWVEVSEDKDVYLCSKCSKKVTHL